MMNSGSDLKINETADNGFANHPHIALEQASDSSEATSEGLFSRLTARFADASPLESYDRSVRANPYLHLAVAGAGALALGFFLGRTLSSAKVEAIPNSVDRDEELDEAIDE